MLKSTYWLLRNLKFYFFVPIFIFVVFLPLDCWLLHITWINEMDEFYSHVFAQLQIFIPLFSVWWSIFILKEFIETDGNELLYIHSKHRNILAINLLVCLLYTLFASIFIIGFNIIFGGFGFVVLEIFSECFALCTATYFFCFALKSTGLSFMFMLSYCIFLNEFAPDGHFKVMSIFMQSKDFSSANSMQLLINLGAAILFLAAGYKLSIVRKMYN